MLLIENWFKEKNATLEKKTKKLERREQHGGFQSHFFTQEHKKHTQDSLAVEAQKKAREAKLRALRKNHVAAPTRVSE